MSIFRVYKKALLTVLIINILSKSVGLQWTSRTSHKQVSLVYITYSLFARGWGGGGGLVVVLFWGYIILLFLFFYTFEYYSINSINNKK